MCRSRFWLIGLLLLPLLAACDPYDPNDGVLFPTPTPARPTAERTSTPAPPAIQQAASATPQPSPTGPAALTASVFNGGNLRDAPSLQSRVLDQIHANERVILLARSADGGWYRIINPRDVTGWVSRTLLTVTPEVLAQLPQAGADGLVPAFPADWVVYAADALEIALPPAWQALPLTREDLQEEANQRKTSYPTVARSIQQVIDSGQYLRLRFFAIEPASQANVTLIVSPGDPLYPPQQVLQAVIDELPQIMPGLRITASDTSLHIDGREAARVEYDTTTALAGGVAEQIHTVQFYIADGTNIDIITFSGPYSAALVEAADQIARAVRVGQRPAAPQGGSGTRLVTNGGNLRSAPQLRAESVLGQVCPGDQVAPIEARQEGAVLWYRVRVVATAADCDPQRVAAGAEGWLSTALLDGSAAPTATP